MTPPDRLEHTDAMPQRGGGFFVAKGCDLRGTRNGIPIYLP